MPTPARTPTSLPSSAPTQHAAYFDDITLSGDGDDVVLFSIPEGGGGVAHVTYEGRGNFVVWTLAADGTRIDPIVAKLTNPTQYAGSVLVFNARELPAAFEITADGSWTIVIQDILKADVWDGASTLTGTTDNVYVLSPRLDQPTPAHVSHLGIGNFMIQAYTGERSMLLVNEVGTYDHQALLPSGLAIVTVVADGDWLIDPEP